MILKFLFITVSNSTFESSLSFFNVLFILAECGASVKRKMKERCYLQISRQTMIITMSVSIKLKRKLARDPSQSAVFPAV